VSRLSRKARPQRAFCFVLAGLLAAALGACARGKDDAAAYQVCLEVAKKDPKYGKAKLGAQADSNIQASAGDADIRVNIPYELDGKKGLYQCIAAKQTDGTYKVSF
jgi:hypothetical protein